MGKRPNSRTIILLFVAFASVHVLAWCMWLTRRTEPPPIQGGTLQCGHWAVIRSSQMLGLGVSPAGVLKLLPRHVDGHTLLEIKDALEHLGYSTDARKETLEHAVAGPFPVVLHLTDPDHFVVLTRHAKGELLLFDGLGRRTRLTTDAIAGRFDGYTLHVSVDRTIPLPKTAARDTTHSACVQFDSIYVDHGDISVNEKTVVYEFPFRNLGNRPLHISKLAGDCSCLDVTGPDVVAPNSRGKIIARFSHQPERKITVFEHEISMETNDPLFAHLIVVAAGNTNTSLIAHPLDLDFGRVHVGQRQLRRIYVQYNGQDNEILKLASIQCKFPGCTMRVMTRDEYLASSPMSVGSMEKSRAFGDVRVIELVWSPTAADAGKTLAGEVRIDPPRPDLDNIVVSLRGTVHSEVATE